MSQSSNTLRSSFNVSRSSSISPSFIKPRPFIFLRKPKSMYQSLVDCWLLFLSNVVTLFRSLLNLCRLYRTFSSRNCDNTPDWLNSGQSVTLENFVVILVCQSLHHQWRDYTSSEMTNNYFTACDKQESLLEKDGLKSENFIKVLVSTKSCS